MEGENAMFTNKHLVLPLAILMASSAPAFAQLSVGGGASGGASSGLSSGAGGAGLGVNSGAGVNTGLSSGTGRTGLQTNTNTNANTGLSSGTGGTGMQATPNTGVNTGVGTDLNNSTQNSFNGNGSMSRETFEATGRIQNGRTFDSVDTNRDGVLDQTELNASGFTTTPGVTATSQFGIPGFRQLDTDSNGTLTMQEFSTAGVQNSNDVFRQLDTNHDNLLSARELHANRADRLMRSRQKAPIQ
jgi:Ca2+-binding EF-hand superfamily protein